MNVCPFCTLPAEWVIHTSQHGVIIKDGYPISTGHILVIPRRHVDSFFYLTADERTSPLKNYSNWISPFVIRKLPVRFSRYYIIRSNGCDISRQLNRFIFLDGVKAK